MPLTEAPGRDGFYPLRVTDLRPETDEAVAVTLAPAPELAALFRFAAGQHLTLRVDIDGEELRRNYSMFSAPDEDALRIAVKRAANGRFSAWATERLRVGDVLHSMPPRGHFTWAFDPARRRRYLAFAGGSGITPILSLLSAGLAAEPLSQFTLLYGNRDSRSIMFLDAIADVKDRYLDRLQVYHFLEAEEDDVDLFNGRLDAARVADLFASLIDPTQIDVAFICGPGPMMDVAEAALLAAGLDGDRILIERFSVGRPAAEAVVAVQATARQDAAGVPMRIALDGRWRTVSFDAAQGNILDSARAAGVPAPFACKAGVCATCRAKLISGEVRMLVDHGLSAADKQAGYILTCQSVPVGGEVALDYDG